MRFLTTLLFLFMTSQLFGQLTINTSYKHFASWNAEKEEWTVIEEKELATTFAFDRELTKFKHTIPDMSSMYYIDDWKFDEEKAMYTMIVTSDANNEYELIIDGINNFVGFFFWQNNVYYLVRHTISSTKFEE